MGVIWRYRFWHIAGLALFALQLADVPAIAADVAITKYRICPHTKARFLRGDPCPCGHSHTKKNQAPRFVSEHGDCDSGDDSERLRAPGFEAFVFTFESAFLEMREISAAALFTNLTVPTGLFSDPPDLPS
ncbi:MAG: hypothetical protein U1F27_07975 [Turneriella sp.]